MKSFSSRIVVRESFANVRATPTLSAVVALLSVASALALMIGTFLDVSTIASQYEEEVSAGINVVTISASNSQPLDGKRCEQLNTVEGVLSAGGIVGYRPLTIEGTDSYVRDAEVTRGYAAIVWPDLQTLAGPASVIAGSSLAAQQGLRGGSSINFHDSQSDTESSLAIAVVAEPSVRNPSFDNYLATIVAPTAEVTSCVVATAPGAANDIAALAGLWFLNTPTSVAPFTDLANVGLTPQELFIARISRAFPILAWGMATTGMLALWTIRRSDFALYRLLGLRAPKLFLGLTVEFAVLVLVPQAAGFLAGLVVLSPSLTSAVVLQALAYSAAQLVVLGLTIPAIGLGVLMSKRPISIIRGEG